MPKAHAMEQVSKGKIVFSLKIHREAGGPLYAYERSEEVGGKASLRNIGIRTYAQGKGRG